MSRANFNGSITATGGTVTSLDLSANFKSDPIFIGNVSSASIQLTIAAGSTAVGSVIIQTSEDAGTTETSAAAGLSNWTDVSGSTASLSGTTGSPIRWDLTTPTSRWLRLSYTFTSGAGNATARITGKGPS